MGIKHGKALDPDLSGARAALERAALRARRLAEETGTPLYVLKNGSIVNLSAEAAPYVLHDGRCPK